MQPNEDEDFEATARALRIKLGIENQLQPDMITVIYKLKDHGLINNYVRVPDADMRDDEAFFDSENRILYLRESAFSAASAVYTYSAIERRRARFTIAHEVGHIALRHDGVRYRGKSNSIAEKVVQKIRVQERHAQKFAIAFLAPAHLA